MEKLPQHKQTKFATNILKTNPPITLNDNYTTTLSQLQTQAQTNEPLLIIDSTSSKFTISLFASFIILIISAFIVCGFLPNAYSIVRKSESKCQNPTTILANYSIECSQFDINNNPKRGMLVKGLNDDNQYVITNTNFFLVDPELETTLKGDVRFEQYKTTNQNDDSDKVENEIISVQAPYQVDSISKYNKIYNDQAMLLGLQHQLFYQHTIVSSNQLFIADFLNLSAQPNVKNVTMEIIFINSSFTRFSVGIRLAFFALSLLFCIYYILRFRRIEAKIKVIQHKLILVLSILLVFFNNPLIILAFKGQQNFLVFFTQLTSILFPVFLVFFWISAFERGDTQNTLHQSNVLKRKFKWILFTVLLAFQLAIYLYKAYHHLLDYIGNPYQDPKPLVVLDYISFSIAVICLIFILIRAVNIFRNTQTMSRYRVLVVLSLFFIIYMAIFLFSESFYIFSIKPKSIFLVMVFMNLYVFYLQVLYQPIEYALIQPSSARQIPSITTNSRFESPAFPYSNKDNAPKLSTIIQRSVEQSVGKFSYIENHGAHTDFKIENNMDSNDNLDNFEIGDPAEQENPTATRSIQKIDYKSKIEEQIEEESQELDGPSSDLNSQKNIDSSLIKSNKESQQN